jgi:hypothetical protein
MSKKIARNKPIKRWINIKEPEGAMTFKEVAERIQEQRDRFHKEFRGNDLRAHKALLKELEAYIGKKLTIRSKHPNLNHPSLGSRWFMHKLSKAVLPRCEKCHNKIWLSLCWGAYGEKETMLPGWYLWDEKFCPSHSLSFATIPEGSRRYFKADPPKRKPRLLNQKGRKDPIVVI